MDDQQIIFCSGLGSTGSSAYVNVLQDVKEIMVYDREFRLLVDPDGILDLRRTLFEHWSYFKIDMALRRYKELYTNLSNRGLGPYSLLQHNKVFKDFYSKSNNHFQSILEFEYRGIWYGIDTILSRAINKIGYKSRNNLNSKIMYVPKNISKSEFDHITRKYLMDLFYSNIDNSKSTCVIEENLLGLFAEEINEILPNSKILNIVRDPLDVIADSIRVNWNAAPKNVDDYVDFQKKAYKKLIETEKDYIKKGIYGKSIRTFKFESLVLDTEQTVKEIEDYIEIPNIRKKVYKNFNPEISVKNIGIHKKFLTTEEILKIKNEFIFYYEHYNYQK